MIEWNDTRVAWTNFKHSLTVTYKPLFELTKYNEGNWIDIDVLDLIESGRPNKFALSFQTYEMCNDACKNTFGSWETCFSPKLVVMTEPI